MSEVQDAMQIFAITIQGIEVCFRITKELLKALQKLIKFLSNMLFHEKLLGKTSMKDLLKQGVNLEVCQVPNDRMKEFKKFAKKYGILYTEVPGGKGGMTDILFRKEDTPRMNLLFERMGLGKVDSKDIVDFVNNMSDKDIYDIAPTNPEVVEFPSEVTDKIKEMKEKGMFEKYQGMYEKYQNPGMETSKEIYDDKTMEKMREFHNEMEDVASQYKDNQMNREEFNQAVQNIQFNVLSNHPSYEEINVVTRSKEGNLLLVDETRDKIKVRIPYVKDRHIWDKYIWLDKKEAFISGDRSKITAFLRRDRDYDIVDRDNRKIDGMKGSELRKKFFAPVKQRQKNRSQDKTRQQNQNKTRTQEKPKKTKSK